MFSQSLLRGLVNSANSWQREARMLCSHLPFSSVIWNGGSIKLKCQVWQHTVDFVAELTGRALLPSGCRAAVWDCSQSPSAWMESWGNFGTGGSRTSLCPTCRHPKSLPLEQPGKRYLELSGQPPDLQLLWGDPHRAACGWPSPNLGHSGFYQTCLENCCNGSEVCWLFRGQDSWLMSGMVPPECVCSLWEVPISQGSPCRDGWSIRGEGRKASHQLGGCIEHGQGNKPRNILTQTCEKQSKNDLRTLMNTFANRKRRKYFFLLLLLFFFF